MKHSNHCESCGMSINDGTYCQYCTDGDGKLQAFNERFERMVQWVMKENKDLSRGGAENTTKEYMRTMPAWQNHPDIRET
ncbi:hypothetical protein GCM10007978_33120 [Shewanella hanedai]|uniref:Putative zinc ribbon domain-containing protein n=1 Tax=Shewanella hanedai TaxID=25 RepID=A0A553JJX1_SHEHA|nr:zinc ribbon domain-containing protein [Shewanella hanedai]TRY12751.1 hypothetical protein FN961_18845 [Shewanella hanedai]GGI92896.1 hypothetical protein GCM10007978_33120 [Shewanella hanedai]